MALQPIAPRDDPRVTHDFAELNGRRYHYVQGMPKGEVKRTVLCIHGFPDLWYGWRKTIPALLELGLRVIVPDMMGYGQTEAPRVPPESMATYGFKRAADDMAELMRQLNIPKVVLLGHDWGGAIVYRIYHHHPTLVTHIAAICTPYFPLCKTYVPLEEFVQKFPNFTYQIAFANPQTAIDLEPREKKEQFFRALYRRPTDPRSPGSKFQVTENIVESLGNPPLGTLISQEELDYYVDEYSRNGFHGPLTYYRIREQHYLDEKDFGEDIVPIPCLFIAATYDAALPPSINHTEKYVEKLTYRQVDTSHWAMVEDPENINAHLKEWFEGVVFGGSPKI
ncbi:hypothetical protein RUND412_004394 [Rhizina undulata]